MNVEEKEVRTSIWGYQVDLEIREEFGEAVSSCWVTRGNYCSSLALIEGEGGYYSDEDDFRAIQPHVVNKISEWALANGY